MELELVPERYLLLLKRARIKLVANIAVMILSFILLFGKLGDTIGKDKIFKFGILVFLKYFY